MIWCWLIGSWECAPSSKHWHIPLLSSFDFEWSLEDEKVIYKMRVGFVKIWTETHLCDNFEVVFGVVRSQSRRVFAQFYELIIVNKWKIYLNIPESRHPSKLWISLGETGLSKAKVNKSANKVIPTVFWDHLSWKEKKKQNKVVE